MNLRCVKFVKTRACRPPVGSQGERAGRGPLAFAEAPRGGVLPWAGFPGIVTYGLELGEFFVYFIVCNELCVIELCIITVCVEFFC